MDITQPELCRRWGQYGLVAWILASVVAAGNIVYEERWFVIFANVVEPLLVGVGVVLIVLRVLGPHIARIPMAEAVWEIAGFAKEQIIARTAAEESDAADLAPVIRLVHDRKTIEDKTVENERLNFWRPASADADTAVIAIPARHSARRSS